MFFTEFSPGGLLTLVNNFIYSMVDEIEADCIKQAEGLRVNADEHVGTSGALLGCLSEGKPEITPHHQKESEQGWERATCSVSGSYLRTSPCLNQCNALQRQRYM